MILQDYRASGDPRSPKKERQELQDRLLSHPTIPDLSRLIEIEFDESENSERIGRIVKQIVSRTPINPAVYITLQERRSSDSLRQKSATMTVRLGTRQVEFDLGSKAKDIVRESFRLHFDECPSWIDSDENFVAKYGMEGFRRALYRIKKNLSCFFKNSLDLYDPVLEIKNIPSGNLKFRFNCLISNFKFIPYS